MGSNKSRLHNNAAVFQTRTAPSGPHLGLASAVSFSHKLIVDRFTTNEQLQQALRTAGLESSQLIVGIDFTKSNTWQGGLPCYPNDCLHATHPPPNPYQQVISIMCKTLAPFDDDGLISAYGFGDSRTTDKGVFSFAAHPDGREAPCVKLEGVLNAYSTIINEIALGRIIMSGPTSFGPIIRKAIELVRATNSYHILIIVCDGAVDRKEDTINAIVEASRYPLSIICVGVGKGPWDTMQHFDDAIPHRDFDNFQFVDFHGLMAHCELTHSSRDLSPEDKLRLKELDFAKHALMEVPEQYHYIKTNIMK